VKERIEQLEAQVAVLQALFEKLLSHQEGLVRDLGLVADIAELRALRATLDRAKAPRPQLTTEKALRLGAALESAEQGARDAHTSVKGLRRRA
jgi:hypothetical protein